MIVLNAPAERDINSVSEITAIMISNLGERVGVRVERWVRGGSKGEYRGREVAEMERDGRD